MKSPDHRIVRVGTEEYLVVCSPETPNSTVLIWASEMALKDEMRASREAVADAIKG